MRSALVHMAWVTYTAEKVPVWSNLCCQPDNVFFREGLVYFSKKVPNQILYMLNNVFKMSIYFPKNNKFFSFNI